MPNHVPASMNRTGRPLEEAPGSSVRPRALMGLFHPFVAVGLAAVGVAAAVLLTSCGSPPDVEGTSGEEDWIVAGPTARIGSVDSPEYAFRSVVALARSPGGFLYSLHRGEATIRRWDPQGRPAGVLGRQGEGPGEFQSPAALGFFGDTLWVMDADSYRVSYFDAEGDFLGSVTPRVDLSPDPQNPYAAPPRPALPLRNGMLYGIAPASSDAVARGRLSGVRHVLMDPEGSIRGTVWVQPYEPSDVLALLRENGGTFAPQPFGDKPLFHVSPRGALLVLDRRVFDGDGTPAIRLTRIDMQGDTMWSREIRYTPQPLPRERLDSAARAQAEGLVDFIQRMDPEMSLPRLESDLREAMFGPEFLPAVKSMVVAEDGSIWLQRFSPSEEGMVWWVLDADAEPLATALTPPGLRVLLITEEEIWGVETDALDVDYIVRYDIFRP